MTCNDYCNFCVPTPQGILDETERDVFDEIVPETDPFHDIKYNALWDRYGDIGVGNCDIDYWVRAMSRRFREIDDEYNLKFQAFGAMHTSVSADGPDLSAGSSEYESVYEQEDLPQTETSESKYLSGRTTNRFSGRNFEGLQTATVREWMDNVHSPVRDWADEFRRLFYWGM